MIASQNRSLTDHLSVAGAPIARATSLVPPYGHVTDGWSGGLQTCWQVLHSRRCRLSHLCLSV